MTRRKKVILGLSLIGFILLVLGGLVVLVGTRPEFADLRAKMAEWPVIGRLISPAEQAVQPTGPAYQFEVFKGNEGRNLDKSLLPEPREKPAVAPAVEGVKDERVLGEVLGAEDPGPGPIAGNPLIRTVQGFGTSQFTGEATISYPISVPPGPGGLAPSLSLGYSSGVVDDMHLGFYIPFGDEWECLDPTRCKGEGKAYYNQASIVGLGWNVGGVPQVTKDYKTGEVYLSLGGNVKIVPVAGGFKTAPDNFFKVEMLGSEYGWKVTTKDGTVYTFGSSYEYVKTSNQGGAPLFIDYANNPGAGWIVEAIKDCEPEDTCQLYVWQRRMTKWNISSIQDVHGNRVDFKYKVAYDDQRLKCLEKGDPHALNAQYVSSIHPTEIIWNNGHYKVVFNYENRDDWEVPNHQWACVQAMYDPQRVSSIDVLVDGTIARRYKLHYAVVGPADRDDNTAKHSLLTEIEEIGKNPAESLPRYTFTYVNPQTGAFDNENPNFHVLRTADNGYGGKVTYTYGHRSIPFTSRTGVTDSSGGYGSHREVVVSRKIEDGMGNFYIIDNTYGTPKQFVEIFPGGADKDGKVVPEGRGYKFLGFSSNREVLYGKNDSAKASKMSDTRTSYLQSLSATGCFNKDPRSGSAYKVESFIVGNTVHTQVGNSIRKRKTDGTISTSFVCSATAIGDETPDYIFTQSVTTDIDFIVTRKTTVVETLTLDAYGNVTKSRDRGDTAVIGDETISYTNYATPNLTKYIVNRPKETWIRDVDSSTAPKYNSTRYFYDGNNTTLGTLGEKGLVTRVEKLDGTKVISRVDSTYNSAGLPVSATSYKDPSLATAPVYTSTTTYDPFYGVYPVEVTNPKGWKAYTVYDYVLGVPTETVDVNGFTTHIRYDGYGRVVKAWGPKTTESDPAVQFSYYDFPSVTLGASKMAFRSVTNAGNGKKLEAISFYDGLGQVVQSQTKWTSWQAIVTNSEYDSRGNAFKVYQPYSIYSNSIDGFGDYVNPDTTQYAVVTLYDQLGRVTQTNYPDGTKTKMAYSGFMVKTTDKNGQVAEQERVGRTNYARTYINSGAKLYSQVTTKNNVLGLPISVSDYKNFTTKVTYDTLGRKTQIVDPDAGTWKYTYDGLGNLLTQTDAKGEVTAIDYDELSRPTQKRIAGVTHAFTYDAGYNAKGRLVAVNSPPDVSSSTRFDELGRVIQQDQTIEGAKYSTWYTYDLLGNVLSLTYPDGEKVNFIYDEALQLIWMKSNLASTGVVLAERTYNDKGQLTIQTVGNQIVSILTYDPKNLRLLSKWDTLSGANVLFNGYTYKPSGDILSWASAIGNEPTQLVSYVYDDLSRLVQTIGQAPDSTYSYDDIGRILTKNDPTGNLVYSYSGTAPVHAPASISGKTMSYDANGNLVADGSRTLAYDRENRLSSVHTTVTDTSGVINFVVEPDNGTGFARNQLLIPQGMNIDARSLLAAAGPSCPSVWSLSKKDGNTSMKTFVKDYSGENFSFLAGESVIVGNPATTNCAFAYGTPIELEVDTSFKYDASGTRVVRDTGTEKTVYVGGIFEKDLVSGKVRKYYFAGGQRLAVSVVEPREAIIPPPTGCTLAGGACSGIRGSCCPGLSCIPALIGYVCQ